MFFQNRQVRRVHVHLFEEARAAGVVVVTVGQDRKGRFVGQAFHIGADIAITAAGVQQTGTLLSLDVNADLKL